MNKLLQGDELERKAIDLGIDIQGPAITQSSSGRQRRADDSDLQRRVIEAERSKRESKLWMVALISSVASVISAVTAIIVVVTAATKNITG
ncbi:hypothetical protein JYU12_00905 [bacterium AH-315-K03]|nr:hypothetical protein [bacterium AH-315-K03]